MVRACGALIAHLMEDKNNNDDGTLNIAEAVVRRDRRTAEVRLGSAKRFQVTSVTRLELDGRLHLEANVYDYLQIFHSDPHPSALGGVPKEGISLYSFLDRCASKMGSTMLKQWLLAPLSDPSLIESRLDTIDHLWVWMDNEVSEKLKFHLRHARDLRLALTRINTNTAPCKDWSNLKETCTAALRLRELFLKEFAPLTAPPHLFVRIMNTDPEPLSLVSHLITECLDLKTPTSDKKPQIRGGVDAELDRLRSVMADLNGFLDEVAKSELEKYRGISSIRVVYVPQIQYQLVIPIDEDLPADHPDSPVRQFSSNQHAYYRSKTTLELNEMLGDVSPQFLDRRDAVLHSLANRILPFTTHLLRCAQWIAELDVLVSLTRVSKENGFIRPTILNPIDPFLNEAALGSGAIRIEGGRHPLLEHVMSKEAKPFVANSTDIGLATPTSSNSSVHILLGPNGSGKSVYITQTGLIVFMAHLGCYVPATQAEICVVDHLFTFSSSRGSGSLPLKSKDSITSITSTGSGVGSFLNDAHNMGRILRNATPLSLVLIDEFGRGTVESDALALLVAVIEQLCTPRPLRTETEDGSLVDSAGCPKTLISSHLKLLHSTSLDRLGSAIAFFHMNAVVPEHLRDASRVINDVDFDRLLAHPTYLYQLTPVTNDYQPPQLGVHVAKMAGMEHWVLQRALEVKRSLFLRVPLPPVQVAESRINTQREAEESQRVDRALALLEENFGSSNLARMDTMDAPAFINHIFGPN